MHLPGSIQGADSPTSIFSLKHPQKMSSVSQVALSKRGYKWGYKISLKVKKSFIYMAFQTSFNRPQPTNTLKANPNRLAFF